MATRAMDVDLVVSPGVIDIAGQRLMMRPVSGYALIHVEKPHTKVPTASKSEPSTSVSRWPHSSRHRRSSFAQRSR